METFQHIMTLVSIIIGLGLTQILTNINALIKERRSVKFYWLSLYWAAGAFTVQIQWWWGIYRMKSLETWDFYFFLFLILNPITMYLASGTVLPHIQPGTSTDLRSHYYENSRWFFLLCSCNPLLDILRKVIFQHQYITPVNIANLVPLVLFISLAFVKNERYHIIVSILMTISLTYFITSFSYILS